MADCDTRLLGANPPGFDDLMTDLFHDMKEIPGVNRTFCSGASGNATGRLRLKPDKLETLIIRQIGGLFWQVAQLQYMMNNWSPSGGLVRKA
jgi:hypothetical protein